MILMIAWTRGTKAERLCEIKLKTVSLILFQLFVIWLVSLDFTSQGFIT
ncbi:hypothetical protein RV15_GL000565 [Enterococcus silesiacus]|uniref:Uncharacterized protein n=1 Tax=Enterococcus silesiacus TaxID=332949 RepID=A0AA91G9V0_9ENTE|nr:hypothetical protein RV15_GL000565 [Enterococcus silesiacus]